MAALFVAPAIIRAENLMRVHEMELPVPDWCPPGWLPLDGREIKKKFYPDLYSAYERMRFPMKVASDQDFQIYSGYQASPNVEPRFARIIAAKDQIRSNGTVARAGITSTIMLPATIQ